MFKQNIGTTDRVIRIALGIVLAAIGILALKGPASTIVGIVALLPLITGIIGFCPSYAPFKLSTIRVK